jgi:hypothetical protein
MKFKQCLDQPMEWVGMETWGMWFREGFGQDPAGMSCDEGSNSLRSRRQEWDWAEVEGSEEICYGEEGGSKLGASGHRWCYGGKSHAMTLEDYRVVRYNPFVDFYKRHVE